jgi:hypothetical protein
MVVRQIHRFFYSSFWDSRNFWFLGLVCYAVTQLAIQLPQERIQVVRSNKVAWKRLTESNGELRNVVE